MRASLLCRTRSIGPRLSRAAASLALACLASCSKTVSLEGRVVGIPLDRDAAPGSASATLRGSVHVCELDADGRFAFHDLTPGRYLVEASLDGFDTGVAVSAPAPGPAVELLAVPLPGDAFVFRWRGDASEGGAEHTSGAPRPYIVPLGEQSIPVADLSAAHRLAGEFDIALSDEEQAWTAGQAYALLATLRELPALETLPSRWVLTARHLAKDVEIERLASSTCVRVSLEAFSYALPRAVRYGSLFGRMSSRRLTNAVLRWSTDEGRDTDALERLLSERHGTSIRIADYEELTRASTGESAARFQPFGPEELLLILGQLEELPLALHAIPGLTFLARRLDGTRHPLHPDAPAVSWPRLEKGYIEFMESAFLGSSLEHAQRLVLHEKAHFFWERVLDDEEREAWQSAGQWYESAASPSGWSTRDTTGFVSPYAHALNPDEDLAESIAWFVSNPDKLRSRSPRKHDFVARRVMQNTRYLSQVRADLTFVVENERPDHAYPGRVEALQVTVAGAPEEDKLASIEIDLRVEDGELDDARGATLRLSNEAGVHEDVRLEPIDADGQPLEHGSRLRGVLHLSRFAKSGFWTAGQLVVRDAVGNERYERGGNHGWKMFVDNPLEDVVPPRYVAGSLEVVLESERRAGVDVQVAVATWKVEENERMSPDQRVCSTSIARVGSSGASLTTYGTFDASSATCTTRTLLGAHRAGGEYALRYLTMRDAAGNSGRAYFTDSEEDERPRTFRIETADPDLHAPELDLDDIQVAATAARSDDSPGSLARPPDGETRVSIVYRARDDKSGLGAVSLQLRDPLGVESTHYHYHENFHGPVFRGDPTRWGRYELEIFLPVGSPPGTWGVTSINLSDKAGNTERFDFTETLRFELIEN